MKKRKPVNMSKKEEKMQQDVIKPESNKAVGAARDLSKWGPAPVSSKDIVIPRILLMQGLSEQVTEGNAKFGEFRDSLTNKLMGDMKTGFKVIPFAMKKLFIEYDCTNPKKKEFLRAYDITPQNENLPYEDTGENKEGKKVPISRDYTMNFYCLLPENVAAGISGIPYILTFRRTALQEGKKLATQMYTLNLEAGMAPCELVVEIQAKKMANDTNSWAVPVVVLDPSATRRVTDKEYAACELWFGRVNAGATKVHEESFVEDVKAETAEAVNKGPSKF